MCLKCYNKFMNATYDDIAVKQRAMPKESETIWIVIGVVCFLFITIVVMGSCLIHHYDEKKEEKWKRKFMEERLQQIDEKH